MAHYSDETPIKQYSITITFGGERFELYTSDGLFSKDKLDTGSALLLRSMQLPPTGRVLDLGCGIGVVGVLVKRFHPSLDVVQSDVTEKAVTIAMRNAKKARVATRIVRSDCYDALVREQFDVILVNPPRAAGKAVIERMISEAPAHLRPGGSLQLVAMTNKGGASYAKLMDAAFGNVEKIGRGSGFSVYRSVRATD